MLELYDAHCKVPYHKTKRQKRMNKKRHRLLLASLKLFSACTLLYSLNSLVKSGPLTSPQPKTVTSGRLRTSEVRGIERHPPANGITITVALSLSPMVSAKDITFSAARCGDGACLARSTISSSDKTDVIPSDSRMRDDHVRPKKAKTGTSCQTNTSSM